MTYFTNLLWLDLVISNFFLINALMKILINLFNIPGYFFRRLTFDGRITELKDITILKNCQFAMYENILKQCRKVNTFTCSGYYI